MARHYGMDWLRIGAFAILIFYHIGMVFVPWPFHVKSGHVEDWAKLPMLAVNAWRLSLLFVVSGYASRALLTRSGGLGSFARNRTLRLMLPFLFGCAVIVPPQPWVELVTQHGYQGAFLTFWRHDYFRFGLLAGIVLPTWNHLWFVLYLWAYTLALAAMLALVRLPRAQNLFDHVFGGFGVLLLPLGWLVAIHAWWFPMVAETHAFVGDTMAHLSYVPAFLFGFGLARSAPAMAAIARWWPVAAFAALASYAWIVTIELGWIAAATPFDLRVYGAAHAIEQWGGIVALIGVAERWWNRDGPLRATLTEAVFPFYIIHQTIIVVVTFWLLPTGLSGGGEFAILAAATLAGCWAFYLIGRAIPWLRPLIGLRALPHRPRVAPTL